jgi:hypothetical protein
MHISSLWAKLTQKILLFFHSSNSLPLPNRDKWPWDGKFIGLADQQTGGGRGGWKTSGKMGQVLKKKLAIKKVEYFSKVAIIKFILSGNIKIFINEFKI